MATKFRMHGKTPGGVPLCRSCLYGNYVKGDSLGREELYCDMLSGENNRRKWEAYECNQYSDRSKTDLPTMQKVAWILSSDAKSTGRIGFVAPGTEEHRKLIKKSWDDD